MMNLDVNSPQKTLHIAFVGHPNSGKTTLFNALNDTHHSVGNWCGVTVSANHASLTFLEISCESVDLPGIRTLEHTEATISLDNQITLDYLASKKADYLINVIDVTHLQEELILTLELLKKGYKLIVVLNMMDLSQKQGQKIDYLSLSQALGCPVIPTIASEKQGLCELKKMLKKKFFLLEQSNSEQNIERIELERMEKECELQTSINLGVQAEKLFTEHCKLNGFSQINWTKRIDRYVLNKWLGIPILLSFMYLAFGFTIHVGGGLQNLFEQILQTIFISWPETFLIQSEAPLWLRNGWVQGLGTGIVTTLCFVPVIGGMYFCISVLETSGYMSRAALVMDNIMQRIGLSGKSFIPMILGFGCNVPAILATRTLENQKQRILTILMSPFMSCGARLAIYALFVTAFFKEGGHNIIFSLYCIGILMAIFTGWIFKKTLFLGESESSCSITLTDYRWPSFKLLLKTTSHRTLRFVAKAGMIILPLCALIGLLRSINIDAEETWLTYLGRFITPCLSPMGIKADNWPATVGLLTGVMAKEVVVGTLNALYTGGNTLGSMVAQFGSHQAAFAYLLFILLYFPCVSVFATIAKELSLAWAIFTAVWTTSLAYTVSVLFYQLSTVMEHPKSSVIWVFILLMWGIGLWFLLRWMGIRSFAKKILKPLPTQILILDT